MSKEKFTYTEEVTGEILQIPVKLLHHHHDNPRKDFGDLTELADSIKAKGVLQNLTVVPFWFEFTGVGCDDPKQQAEMGYLVVIGNRRLEAAKIAGVETLPCIIAKMTPAEQVQTMLLENLQRSDLTVYEQARGFQMMMDFGDTIDTVAEKTGFSKTSIRRRLKIAELNADTLKEVSTRQISMQDFDRLAQIEDISVRNNVLKEIGTKNFENKLKMAIQEQENRANQARWREALIKIGAIEIDAKDIWNGQYKMLNRSFFNLSSDISELEKEVTEGVQYYFAFSYSVVYFRIKKQEVEEDDEARAERERIEAEKKERVNALNEAIERAFELRRDFVKKVSNAKAKANYDKIVVYIIKTQFTPGYTRFDYNEYAYLVGYETEIKGSTSFDLVKEKTETNIYKALLAYAYSYSGDSQTNGFRKWNNQYNENSWLKALYEFLISIGYEMSDEEKELMDGTSSLYEKPEEEDEDDYEDDDEDEEECNEDEAVEEESEDEKNDDEIVNALKEMYDDEDN